MKWCYELPDELTDGRTSLSLESLSRLKIQESKVSIIMILFWPHWHRLDMHKNDILEFNFCWVGQNLGSILHFISQICCLMNQEDQNIPVSLWYKTPPHSIFSWHFIPHVTMWPFSIKTFSFFMPLHWLTLIFLNNWVTGWVAKSFVTQTLNKCRVHNGKNVKRFCTWR